MDSLAEIRYVFVTHRMRMPGRLLELDICVDYPTIVADIMPSERL